MRFRGPEGLRGRDGELTQPSFGEILSSSNAGRPSVAIEDPRRIWPGGAMTIKDLDAFFDAGWNRHDVDFLMTLMSEDCVFESAAGPDICGTRHEGRERVREAFARVFKLYPDAHFGKVRHFIADDRAVSEW